ncbi:MAG: hypothetical protein SYC29_14640 [Planctomycetota bacterium]|nr:hypothetical protein [Planctomycetota bacterium]
MTCVRIGAIVLLSATAAFAQNGRPQQDVEPAGKTSAATFDFTASAGLEYIFGSDINDGGDFELLRGTVGISGTTALTENLDMTLLADYEFAEYDWNGETGLGSREPWDSVHTIGFGALLTLRPYNEWAIFGGPILRFSGESDADFGESFTAGGLVGASYQVSDELLLGAGVGGMTQIEDKVRWFPVIVLDWEFLNDVRLTSRTAASTVGRTGLEIVYDVSREWEVAIGGAREKRRFRLDDGGDFPGGVGEDVGWPVWARLSYQPNPNLELTLYGGVIADGNFGVDDDGGHQLSYKDYDPAGLIGFTANLRF